MPSWPASVPVYALIDSFDAEPDRNVAENRPEIGVPSGRARSIIDTEVVSFATEMTFTQYDTLMSFFTTDLVGGVLSFTRVPPRDPTAATESFRFIQPPD